MAKKKKQFKNPLTFGEKLSAALTCHDFRHGYGNCGRHFKYFMK